MDGLEKQLDNLLLQVTTYNEKPTKAESLRIRNALNQLKKDTTGYKQDLIALDKAGY